MRRRSGWSYVHRALSVTQIVGSVSIVLLAGASAADPAKVEEWPLVVGKTVEFLRNQSIWGAILIIVVGVAQLVKNQIGAPWLWETVEAMLNHYRDRVFSRRTRDPRHYHRVTIFKHVGWRWPLLHGRLPGHGWLVPVARSGHTTRDAKTLFRAPSHDPDKAEGFAGMVWQRSDTPVIPDLPSLGTSATPDTYTGYAKRFNLTVERVRAKSWRSRSFSGFPILVNGDQWGVVVLDSRSPDGLTNENYGRHRSEQELLVTFLSKLLEKG